jgi:hydroxypyruvate isomerase
VSEVGGTPLSFSMSILLAQHPLLDRVALAVAAGYTTLESWWPWPDAVPASRDADDFVAALGRGGASLYLLNLTEGAPGFGGRGLAGVGSQEAAFWSNANAALELGSRVGTRYLNVLAGNAQREGAEAGLAVLEDRLVALGDLAAASGIGLVLEQLNPGDHPDYLIVDPKAAIEMLQRVAPRTSADIGMLADVYHLAASGHDPAAFIEEHHAVIRHVQLADYPGRGRPGSGGIRFDRVLEALEHTGYRGKVGLEYLSGAAPIPDPGQLWRGLRDGSRMTS